ncbi:hypothetical protein SDJN03_00718, partial [Cucurbita argyrosperma subsp. sororia]
MQSLARNLEITKHRRRLETKENMSEQNANRKFQSGEDIENKKNSKNERRRRRIEPRRKRMAVAEEEEEGVEMAEGERKKEERERECMQSNRCIKCMHDT